MKTEHSQNNSIKLNLVFNLAYNLLKMIFPLITFPYVTRILGVETLGRVNFAISVVGYFGLISTLGITTYAVREGVKYRDNRNDISSFTSDIFTINLFSTVISILLMMFFVNISSTLREYSLLIYIYSGTIIFNFLGVDWVNNIYENFKYIAIRNLIFQLGSVFLLLLFVRNKDDSINYLIITGVASSGAGIVNFFHVRRYINIHIVYNNLKIHIGPLLILFASSVATSIYMNIDTIMLGFIKGDVSVGLYTAAVKVNRIMINLIAATNAVLLPRLSLKTGKLDSNAIFNVDVMISLPIGIGLAVTGEYIIKLLCGEGFERAIIAMRILSLSLIFSAINNCLANQYLLPLKYESINMIATIIGATLNLGLNIVFIPFWGVDGAAITTLISELAVFLIFVVFLYKNGRRLVNVGQIKYLVMSLLFLPISMAVFNIDAHYIIKLAMVVLLSMTLYFIGLIILKDEAINSIIKVIKPQHKA